MMEIKECLLYLLSVVANVTLCTLHRYLFTVPNGTELLYQLIEQLILNAGLWTRAATQVLSHTRLLYIMCDNHR